MKTVVVKQNSTAEDAVKLVIETAYSYKDSKAVNFLLNQLPFENTLAWYERMFWLIDSLTTYRFDDPNKEQVKTPDRFLINDKYGDCDDYSTLWLSLLYRVGVVAYPKIVNYQDDPYWDHIYVKVPNVKTKGRNYLVLDNVYAKYYPHTQSFNVEVDFESSQIFRDEKRSFYGLKFSNNRDMKGLQLESLQGLNGGSCACGGNSSAVAPSTTNEALKVYNANKQVYDSTKRIDVPTANNAAVAANAVAEMAQKPELPILDEGEKNTASVARKATVSTIKRQVPEPKPKKNYSGIAAAIAGGLSVVIAVADNVASGK